MKRILVYSVLAVALLLTGCSKDRLKIDLSTVERSPRIQHFDLAFYDTDSTAFLNGDLQVLRSDYPLFFMSGTDTFWQERREDPTQYRLYTDIVKVFGDYSGMDGKMEKILKHLYYYYPSHSLESVQTYISNLDYGFPIVYADSVVFIASDLFLGGTHPAYRHMADYQKFQRQARFLPSAFSEAVITPMVKKNPKDVTLLADMIYWGQVYYGMRALNPELEEKLLMRYSVDEMTFCETHEKEMWTYFIDQEYLFSSEFDLKRRFIETAPFSKFGVPDDYQSPGAIGKWVGYKIVSSYMEEHPEVTVQELLAKTDATEIFKNSKYKP
jgi:hypothetical protein